MEPDFVLQHELSTVPWNGILSRLVKAVPLPNDATPIRATIRGKQYSGVSTFTRCLVNRLLTIPSQWNQSQDREVIVLDCNPESPAFALCDTMAVLKVSAPHLGPAFTNSGSDCEILKMHFAGIVDITSSNQAYMELVTSLVKYIQPRLSITSHIIINLPDTAVDSVAAIERLCSNLAINNIIRMVSSPRSDPSAETIDGITVWCVASPPNDLRVSNVDDQILRLQSYFHALVVPESGSVWSTVPLMAASHTWKTVSLRVESGSCAAVLWLDDLVDFEDTAEALIGDTGVVLSVTRDYFDSDLRQQIRSTTTSLPRLERKLTESLPPTHVECLGMAIVFEISLNPVGLRVSTPIAQAALQPDANRVLILMHPGRRQRQMPGSEWVAEEIENASTV
jgi:polynucleotide 5'-kinase involved in rRNA processing